MVGARIYWLTHFAMNAMALGLLSSSGLVYICSHQRGPKVLIQPYKLGTTDLGVQ